MQSPPILIQGSLSKMAFLSFTTVTPWALIICGDLREPIILTIPDPHTWTATQLKNEVEKKTKIPVNEQTLYCGETPLLDNTLPLAKYKAMKNGKALCLARSSYVIKAEHQYHGGIVEVAIPRSEFNLWTSHILHEYICFKFGFPENCKHYLFSGTTVIEDNEQKITQCPVITEGCTLLFIPLKELKIASPIDSSGKLVHIPPTISQDFLLSTFYNERPLHGDSYHERDAWKGSWDLKVIKVDPIHSVRENTQPATKIIHIPEHAKTPVSKLREIIFSEFAVPINQQRIKIGDITLEDWDDDDRILLLQNYPNIHDGATIHLEVMEESDRVMNIVLKEPSTFSRLSPSKKDLCFPDSSSIYPPKGIWSSYSDLPKDIVPPSSITIHNPDKMTLMRLYKIVKECEYKHNSDNCLDIEEKNQIDGAWTKTTTIDVKDDSATVKSIAALKDGCRVSVPRKT